MTTLGDGKRLPVGLGCKGPRTYIGNPNLNRSQTCRAEGRAMLLHPIRYTCSSHYRAPVHVTCNSMCCCDVTCNIVVAILSGGRHRARSMGARACRNIAGISAAHSKSEGQATRLHKFALDRSGPAHSGSADIEGIVWTGGQADFRLSEKTVIYVRSRAGSTPRHRTCRSFPTPDSDGAPSIDSPFHQCCIKAANLTCSIPATYQLLRAFALVEHSHFADQRPPL
jgi:hypothetical protein